MGLLARGMLPLFVLVMALKAANFASFLGIFKGVDYASNEGCVLIDGFESPGSEDITEYMHGQFFVSSGDLRTCFHEGIEKASPGGIYLVDVRKPSNPRNTKLEIQGMPPNIAFQPHGIFYARMSRTMHVVSHGFRKGGSRVLIFEVSNEGDAPPKLVYSRSTSFENAVINDVIGISPTEFYVTRWLARPLPIGGKLNPENTSENFMLKIQPILDMLVTDCVVYHCKWGVDVPVSDDAQCQVVLEGFHTANGITISNDLKTVYVNDLLMQRINVYERNDDDASLLLIEHIPLPHLVDNIEFSQSGEIFMGTIPVPYLAVASDESPPGEIAVPGGSLVLTRDPNTKEYKLADTYEHDGSRLSQIASSFQQDGYVLLGSPFAQGLLFCPL